VVKRLIAERFAVYRVQLDPAIGSEMRKTRPCVVLSPELMHRYVFTVIIAPLTSTRTRIPTRIPIRFLDREGEIALDQMRSVDVIRLGKRLGNLDSPTIDALQQAVAKLFA
jgi:mRNA interferase MazF